MAEAGAALIVCLIKTTTTPPPPTPFSDWYFLFQGPPDTDYEGGVYVGRVRFPHDFPFKPPALFAVTPSGRFAVNQSICELGDGEEEERDWG